jgi:sulfide:quinone oxidoreductase
MSRREVLVAGGGVAAVEALLALRELAPGTFDVTLLAPNRALVLAPETVTEATGGAPAARYDLAGIAADLGATLVPEALEGVDVTERRLLTQRGRPLAYDALLIALGALPGHVLPGALRFAGTRDAASVRAALEALPREPRTAIALVATGGVGWVLPLYELACLIAARSRAEGIARDIVVVTAEAQPLGVFGRAASRTVAGQLTALGITSRTGELAERAEGGRLWLATGESLPADLVISLPEPAGPAVPGLPVDDRGFVPVDGFGRVAGVEAVWAAGDVTSRPLKQGGLAIQQADAAAASIAAWAGADVEPLPYEPVLRGLMLTGAAPRYLRRSATSTVPSTSSSRPLWSLDAKLAGGWLARYLDVHPDLRLGPATRARP